MVKDAEIARGRGQEEARAGRGEEPRRGRGVARDRESQLTGQRAERGVTAAKPDVEKAIADLKDALSSDDADRIKTATTQLAQAAMKIGEAVYAGQQGAGGEAGPPRQVARPARRTSSMPTSRK